MPTKDEPQNDVIALHDCYIFEGIRFGPGLLRVLPDTERISQARATSDGVISARAAERIRKRMPVVNAINAEQRLEALAISDPDLPEDMVGFKTLERNNITKVSQVRTLGKEGIVALGLADSTAEEILLRLDEMAKTEAPVPSSANLSDRNSGQ